MVVLSLFLRPSIVGANLVVNGSFEDPIATPGSPYFNTVTAGETTIVGWGVGGTSVDLLEAPRWPAFDGNQSIDLAGTPGPGSIEQFITTEIGVAYALSFALTSNTGGAGDYTVTVGFGQLNETVVPGIPLGTYLTFERIIVADSTSTLLRFSSASENNFGGIVDDVRVVAVPEPAALSVFCLCVGTLLHRSKARRP